MTPQIRCMSEQMPGSFALHPPVSASSQASAAQHHDAIDILVPHANTAPVEALVFILDWCRENSMFKLSRSLPLDGDGLVAAAYRADICIGYWGKAGVDREYAIWARLPRTVFDQWAQAQGQELAHECGWPADWAETLASKLT